MDERQGCRSGRFYQLGHSELRIMTRGLLTDREYKEYLDDPAEENLVEVTGDPQQHNEAFWTSDEVIVNEGKESNVEYEDNAAEFDEWVPMRHRKQLVISLDSCLVLSNYDECIFSRETKEYTSILKKPKGRTDAGKKIIWINKNHILVSWALSISRLLEVY